MTLAFLLHHFQKLFEKFLVLFFGGEGGGDIH